MILRFLVVVLVVGIFCGNVKAATDSTYKCTAAYQKDLAQPAPIGDVFTFKFSTAVQNQQGRNSQTFEAKLPQTKKNLRIVITDMENSCTNPSNCQRVPEWKGLFVATVFINPTLEVTYFSGNFVKGQMVFQTSLGVKDAHASLYCKKDLHNN